MKFFVHNISTYLKYTGNIKFDKELLKYYNNIICSTYIT